jgi:hypothetical protein
VSGQDGIVWFHNSSRHLRCGVNGEFQLRLLTIVDGESFHQQGGESRSGASSEGVEDEESLQSRTLISKLTNPVQNEIHNLLTDGVVTSSVIVRSVLLSSDQLLRVEQLSVRSRPHLIYTNIGKCPFNNPNSLISILLEILLTDDGGLEVDHDSPGHMLSSSRLGEKGVEGVVPTPHCLVRGHLAIGLNPVLQTVQLPTGISDLDSSLSDVDRDTLTLDYNRNTRYSKLSKNSSTKLST